MKRNISDDRPAVDRIECGPRRFQRFFSAGGLVERYEWIGDHLIQLGDLETWLAKNLPGFTPKDVTDLFVLAARHGEFGWRDYGKRRAVASLIDLDGHEFGRGQYPLRPSALTVAARPSLMRARRSVWAAWLQAQGWPTPGWVARSVLVEGVVEAPPAAAERSGDPPAQSTAGAARRRGPRPGISLRVKAAMLQQLDDKTMSEEQLDAMTEEAMAALYGASRDTCRTARAEVLADRNWKRADG